MRELSADYFIHGANILMLVAYSVRDILWLRLFALAASLISIPYFVLQATPLWAAVGWSALFAAINLFQSWRLFLERRPVQLTPEEEEVRRLVFRDLPPRKVLQVLSLGDWNDWAPGERLIQRGQRPDAVSLVVRGTVQVVRERRVLGELGPGDIVGSALILSGAAAEVDAVAASPVRAMSWDVGTLERYLQAHPDTRIVLQQHLSGDLTGKLERLGRDVLGIDRVG
jgi:hypothetical protein